LGFPTIQEEEDFEEEESYDSDDSESEADDSDNGCEMEESFAQHDVSILVPTMLAARAHATNVSRSSIELY
jgi:hypothetical protein